MLQQVTVNVDGVQTLMNVYRYPAANNPGFIEVTPFKAKQLSEFFAKLDDDRLCNAERGFSSMLAVRQSVRRGPLLKFSVQRSGELRKYILGILAVTHFQM